MQYPDNKMILGSHRMIVGLYWPPLVFLSQTSHCIMYLFISQEGRNALIDKRYRWKFPIPYILGDDLGKLFRLIW